MRKYWSKSWPLFFTLLITTVSYVSLFGISLNSRDIQLYDTYFVVSPLFFLLVFTLIISAVLVTIYQIVHLFRPLLSAVYMLVATVCSCMLILSTMNSFKEEGSNSLMSSLKLLLVLFFGLFLVNLFTVFKQLRARRKD